MSFIDISTNKSFFILSLCKNHEIANTVSSTLKESGYAVFSYYNNNYRNNVHEQMEKCLHECKVIVLVDKDSQFSPWLQKELIIAQNQGATIMLIVIDETDCEMLPIELKMNKVFYINTIPTKDNLLSIIKEIKMLI